MRSMDMNTYVFETEGTLAQISAFNYDTLAFNASTFDNPAFNLGPQERYIAGGDNAPTVSYDSAYDSVAPNLYLDVTALHHTAYQPLNQPLSVQNNSSATEIQVQVNGYTVQPTPNTATSLNHVHYNPWFSENPYMPVYETVYRVVGMATAPLEHTQYAHSAHETIPSFQVAVTPTQGFIPTPSTPISSRDANRAFLDVLFHKTVDGRHACKTCAESIKRSSDARRHWRSKHGGENPRCPYCGTVCSRPDALITHLRKACVYYKVASKR